MKDRISLYPGRVKLNPVAGEANTFDMVRADQPTQEGTALNKANLLNDSTAEGLYLGDGEPTPDLAFQKMLKNVQVNSYRHLGKAAGTFWDKCNIKSGNKTNGRSWYIREKNMIVLGFETYKNVYYSTDNGKTYKNFMIDSSAKDSPAYTNIIRLVFFHENSYYAVTLDAVYKSADLSTWTKIISTDLFVADAIYDGTRIVMIGHSDAGERYYHYIELSNETKINQGSSFPNVVDNTSDFVLSYTNGIYFVTSRDGNKVFWTNDCTKGNANSISVSSWYLCSKIHYFNGAFYIITSSDYTVSNGHLFYLRKFTLDGGQKEVSFTSYVYRSSVSDIDPFFELHDNLYFCGWFLTGPDTTNGSPANIYKVNEDLSAPTQIGSVSGSVYQYQPLEITNSGLDNHVIIAGYTTWETYDKYIIEDYLTDIAGHNLTLSPNQSPIHIETGSYIGTGTYGSSNLNSLTFGFEPKLIFIKGVDASQWVMMIYGTKSAYVYQAGTAYENFIIWNEKKISWYSKNAASVQLNNSGTVYNYVAIG